MGRRKKTIEGVEVDIETEESINEVQAEIVSEKDALLALYKTLKDLGINSIGDLENRIANCR